MGGVESVSRSSRDQLGGTEPGTGNDDDLAGTNQAVLIAGGIYDGANSNRSALYFAAGDRLEYAARTASVKDSELPRPYAKKSFAAEKTTSFSLYPSTALA